MDLTGSAITGFAVDSFSSVFAMGLDIILVLFILIIAIYVYLGFAFMAIGRRSNVSNLGLSWIPGIGPLIISFKASKMSWWPWLLLLAFPIFLFLPLTFVIFFPAMILFLVYMVIWDWKMFEAVSRPGWWTLMRLIPIAGFLVYYILIGIAAWGTPHQQFTQRENEY